MAKKSILAREVKKAVTVARYANKVKDLKEVIQQGDDAARFHALTQLNQMPRNFSKSRQSRRCKMCGRPRAVYRLFGLCRICLRQAAMRGDIPGLVKASW